MANQEISLKWNGYQHNILTNVKELFKDEGLSDVTLVCEGHSFKAHKVILSANSSVFRTIFQQNPHKDPIIVLHDINTDSLRTLLSFMYNGEVNVTEDFIPILLKTAETLRICGLSTGCESPTSNEEKNISAPHPKKRKKGETDEITKKPKKQMLNVKPDTVNDSAVHNATEVSKIANIIPKVEPLDSSLSDFSGENTNDTDIALLEDCLEKKYSINTEKYLGKSICATGTCEKSMKKWINEVSSTQPCLNATCDKNNSDSADDDKDSIEIDKEVETVLQSGTIVESLTIPSDNINSVCSESHLGKDKNNTCYANPSFPCPFCPRIYNSWGYRRRHVKSRHMTNRLSCKWCASILSSTGAWYGHATRAHGVPHEDARNSLVVMVEAHAVLTLNEPSVAQLLGQVDMNEQPQVDK
ncbi:Longitudinals lacking protein-like [Eumeta japonica]|uniref:Longitudinals lacking protein-like n=1 Tax=Eumeta variegata TaxID=151549 RepID=A0A4C1V4F2_EUMVA|nr:Longitudinals lacking protein-like [Eumeta japonica]